VANLVVDETRVTRRSFLGGAVMLVTAAPLFPACTPSDKSGNDGGTAPNRPTDIDGWAIPYGTTLDPAHYALLAATMDAFIPGDDTSPGATLAHAAWYVDQLLGAFNTSPPRIFAGGPYSGRHGGLDGFSQFQPLTRVEEIRWRTAIEGSQGIPAREFNGPVVGLVERYRTGLDALKLSAEDTLGASFTALQLDDRRSVLLSADLAFVNLAYGHAVEGTFGDPVYGGNFERRGWTAIRYEGDRQPIGYTAHQMAHPEEEG
jgi:hypothetical protein